MSTYTVSIHHPVDPQKLKNMLREIPKVLAGKSALPRGTTGAFRAYLLRNLFQLLHSSYHARSVGGSDQYGNRWKALKRSTIAYKEAPKTPKGQKGLLSPELTALWAGVYKSTLAGLLAKGRNLKRSQTLAAKIAWGVVKSRGGKTKIEEYGNAKSLIMIRTRRLVQSFKPGTVIGDKYTPHNQDQIGRIHGAHITMGSRVPYASFPTKRRPIFFGSQRKQAALIRDALTLTIDRFVKDLVKSLPLVH